ncbi:hypothetical protein A3G67_02575 [Candidatus Roizmanbacteria bacterium RIFCSPLOWO2_12_FULL_40_12]|uniref:Glucose-6-phosphate 1-dehydrogenase n=1 Tax=Candidatus Roizmanbacteria bacterium RIFCSPLOWO2_01_FULL_40_42 TaxID=1802066 RepID=A0A1F7J638_9BACT|nr:MAG: hypothetical protein A2779_03865 [Candidatus Roizmanbacteria bacterium RIFCSPHIGHO2_01_FULL_40_98]OGK27867.1 MAG: hypothetical protein A3C31_03830 [Candidatus Roizmanbacteria bacterium RIFCSPHIGHO2_02_FULL_40_53]OGK29418.1 MAG: hypothetical protein A2W49_04195 [Candidatus Roizmanbacteria bacterium RIFCSPHIGHO2_12_41_18]OGK36621.1 MAG: hypothetical protein A3E69_00100 [Candidatus Roizmanbacteria bacterium RIFCSPHIGHO2_12_FULL_40_130]OGK51059.1 MAG: hypothetical protein A3B50_02750 [Candi
MANQKNIPTVLVIFGATGDLMTKKITPALYNLFLKGKLPKLFRIVGVARRPLSRDEFRTHITRILEKNETFKIQKRLTEEFLNYFYYHQGTFDKEKDYASLAKELGRVDDEWKVCSNKLFYLSVPPHYYEVIFRHLASSGLTIPCGPDEGWTRVLVEKPFGKDLKTAERLDKLLSQLFKEEQIYRIDHYLAKEMLQNILLFRFSNNLLEPSWNNKYIERIDIRLHEKIGVEGRGAFYDGLGALRDVGQNHLLQMLALVTMNKPVRIDADCVRKNRSSILETLIPPTIEEIRYHTFRAQYEGFRSVDGVTKNSGSETYFKVRAFLDNPRWRSVPIYMESGKRFKKALKEIIVTFKPAIQGESGLKNKVVFSLEPNEEIVIQFISKKPGLETELEKRTLESLYRVKEPTAQYVEEYEKLLVDAIEGNQILFLSTEEIEAMWKYIDPIIEAWKKNVVQLNTYKPDTDEVGRKAQAVEEEQHKSELIKKEVGVYGLGKMGAGMALSLLEKGWNVAGYNRTAKTTKELEREGLTGAFSEEELVKKLSGDRRVILLSLPAGPVVDLAIKKLIPHLSKGDIVIDAGNSFYKDAIRREKELKKKNVIFFDIGVSGGPGGARNGACLMIGGRKQEFELLSPLFTDLALPGGYEFFEGVGAGHFVKMVHNGIEYGMMQALAEGLAILKKSSYKLDLQRVARIYNNGSVIESKLTAWLESALALHGPELKDVSGVVKHTGEGEWTINTAQELKVAAKIIEGALEFRKQSEKNPDYTGKILTALRHQFGGHTLV